MTRMKEKKEPNQKKTIIMVDHFEKTFLGKHLLLIALLALEFELIYNSIICGVHESFVSFYFQCFLYKNKNQRKGAAFVIYIVKRFLLQGDALSNKYSVCVQSNLSFN